MATQFPADSINNRQGVNNPLHKLEENGYNVASFSYPIDLTNDPGENHMIVFYINETNTTQYKTKDSKGDLAFNPDTGQRDLSPTPFDPNGGPAKAQVNSSNNVSTFNKRPINRVSTVITMYIPPLVQTSYNTNWDSPSFGQAGNVLKAALGQDPNIARAIGEGVVGAVKGLLDSGTEMALTKANINLNTADIVSYGTRQAMNPSMEMLFRGIDFRTFQFDFKFTPRSPEEALNVSNIVKAFKFYSAPEIRSENPAAPRFMTYPAEFDIEFWSNGKQNDWINKITTCACTSVQVNYTGANMWAAFRPGNINGMGVETNLTLVFKEVEIITKERIIQGY